MRVIGLVINNNSYYDILNIRKTEDYRLVSPYYISRFLNWRESGMSRFDCIKSLTKFETKCLKFLKFDTIKFIRNYKLLNGFYIELHNMSIIKKNKKYFFRLELGDII